MKKQRTGAAAWAMAAFMIALTRPAVAQWNKSGAGTYTYDDPANWVGGVVNGEFTGTIDAGQTVNFTNNMTVAGLNHSIFSSAGSGMIYYFRSGVGGPRTLTFNGPLRYTPWRVGNNQMRIGNYQGGATDLNLHFAASPMEIYTEWYFNGNAMLALEGANVTAAGTVVKTGPGWVWFAGGHGYATPVDVQGGMISLTEYSTSPSSIGTLASTSITLRAGTAFEVAHYRSATVNNNRLADNATIQLNGGFTRLLHPAGNGNAFYGNFVLVGALDTTARSETIGNVHLQSGVGRVSARVYEAGTSYGNATLTIGSLTRETNAAAIFAGGTRSGGSWQLLGGALNGGVGAQSYIKFTTAPTLTGGILPYAIVAGDSGATYDAFGEFATHDATVGIVPFSRTGTYVTDITTATAADNVRLSSVVTLTTNAVYNVNSLTLNMDDAGTEVAGTGTVRLASGALLINNGGGQLFNIGSVTFDFNGREGFVFNRSDRVACGATFTNCDPVAGLNLIGPTDFSGYQAVGYWEYGGFAAGMPLRIPSGSFSLNVANNPVTVGSAGTWFQRNQGSSSLGALAGDGTVRLNDRESGDYAGGILTIGALNQDSEFSGRIHSGEVGDGDASVGFCSPAVRGGGIVKTGTGRLTLSGGSTFKGTVTLRQGTLVAGTDSPGTDLYGGLGTYAAVGVDIGADTVTGAYANNDVVVFASGQYTTIGGIVQGQPYFVVNAGGSSYQVSATQGGTPINITSTGNVTVTVAQVKPLVVDAVADTMTIPAGMGTIGEGQELVFTALAAPSNLVGAVATRAVEWESEPYYARDVSGSAFKLARTPGGPAVNISSTGVAVRALATGAFGVGTNAVTVGDASTGSNPLALLINGPYTVGRDIAVNNYGTGTTLGGTTNAVSHFTGKITLGKAASLTAAAGGTVHFNTLGGQKITGTGAVNITGAGTVILGGTNDYSGLTTVKAGAALGGSGTIPAGLTFEAGGKLAVTLPANPNDYVPLKVNGAVDVSGAVAVVAPLTFAPTQGLTYVLIANDGTDNVIGSFEPSTFSVTYSGKDYYARITQGGDGNDVVLTFVARGTVISIR